MQTHNLGDTKYLLLTRWVMVNILALIFLAVAWKTGWVTKIYAADEVYAVRAIIVLFSCAFLECTWRIWKTSIELN